MKLYNKSKRAYQHSYFDDKNKLVSITLLPKETKEIDDTIAEIWLKTGEVVEYADPKEVKETQAKLEDENAKLKAEIEALKAELSTADKKEDEVKVDELAELKKQADELGIAYPQNIGVAKLKAKIEAKQAE